MTYQIKKQFGRTNEVFVRSFAKSDEAKAFMQQLAESDAAMKIAVTYRLYDDLDAVIETIDTSKVELTTPTSEGSSGQGKGSTASFRPTPFNMQLTPKGTVPKWNKDADDKEKDKK